MSKTSDPSIRFSSIATKYATNPLSIKVRRKFKLLGHLVLYEVLTWINARKGCYSECDNLEDTAVEFAITRLGSLDYADDVEQIFSYMLEIGFFDQSAYEADKVLTSEGIIKRWLLVKRNPDPSDFPPSVGRIITKLLAAKKRKNADKNSEIDDNDGYYPSDTPNQPLLTVDKTPYSKSKGNSNSSSRESTYSLSYNTQSACARVRTRTDSLSSSPGENSSETAESATFQDQNTTNDPFLTPSSTPKSEETPEIFSLRPPESDPETNRLNTQSDLNGDSSGDYANISENGKITPEDVLALWNETFKNTHAVYRHFNLSPMLSHEIEIRIALDPDIEKFKKVFNLAKQQFLNNDYEWTLHAIFNKRETFDTLLNFADHPPKPKRNQKALADKTRFQGISDPTTYATADEWYNYGKTTN